MYRVLMPVDDDEERALAQAAYVASLPDAANAVRAYVFYVFGAESGPSARQLKRYDSIGQVDSVRRAREYLDERGIDVELREFEGGFSEAVVADDILEEAGYVDADCIVLGGRKQSPVGKVLFGSVTQSVLLRSDLPVVVTGSGPAPDGE